MAVENELIYIVRLNAEGEQEVVKAKRVIDQTGEAATKSEKKVGKLGSGMKSAGKSSADYKKRQSAANNAMLDVTRIAQDAQYGIRGVANNLEQAALSSGRLFEKSDSVTDAFKQMGSSLTGVGGLVAGITALNLIISSAQSGMFSFGEEVKDVASDSEKLIEKLSEINSELNKLKGLDEGGFFSTEGDLEALRRFSVIEEDINDRINDLQRLKDDPFFRSMVQTSSVEELSKRLDRPAEYLEWLIRQEEKLQERSKGGPLFSDDQRQALEQYESDLDAVSSKVTELENKIDRTERLESYPTAAAAETERILAEADNALEDLTKKWDEEFKDTFPIETEIIEPKDVRRSDELEAMTERRAERLSQEAKKEQQLIEKRKAEAQRVEQQITQMRIQSAENAGQRIAALRMQERMEKQQIRDNELLDKEQKERAITAIERKYSQQRKQIAEQEAQQKSAYEQRLVQTKLDAAAMVTNALQGFGSVIAGESEENARKRFEANKAFNYAAAVMNTAAAVTKALPNPIQAAAVGASGAIQIAKIASQKFQSGGAGGGSGNNVGYRGFSFSNPSNNARNNAGRPGGGTDGSRQRANDDEKKVIFIDDLGNMVSKGREKIERGGGDNYMRTGA